MNSQSQYFIVYIDRESNKGHVMLLSRTEVCHEVVNGIHLSMLYVITLSFEQARWLADRITATLKWELWLVSDNEAPSALICVPTYEENDQRVIASYFERFAIVDGERIEQHFDTWEEADAARTQLLRILYKHAEQAGQDDQTALLDKLIANVSAQNDALFASSCASLMRLLKIEAAQKAPAKNVDAA
jgi:hypothetical protein